VRLLLWAPAPWQFSSYAVYTKYLALELAKKHDVAVFAFQGLSGRVQWGDITVFGNPIPHSQFFVRETARRWKADLTIQIFDLWTVSGMLQRFLPPGLVVHTPIDSEPLAEWFKDTAKQAIAVVPQSNYGKRVFEDAGIICEDTIYNGIDTSIFYPHNKEESRETFGIPKDAFVALIVATNKGDRKNMPNQLMAFKEFSDTASDAIVMAWSVVGDTPVMIRSKKDNLIDILPISELANWDEGNIQQKKDLEVYSQDSFTDVKSVMRHPYNDTPLRRIIMRNGFIEISENHSLFNASGQIVNVANLSKGKHIKTQKLPSIPCITEIPEDVAWLYGFFVAEGHAASHNAKNKTKDKVWTIANMNKSLLEKAQSILLKYFATYSRITSPPSQHGIYILKPQNENLFCDWFSHECYTLGHFARKVKKVPKIILNSTPQAMLAFLRGYNDGDGSHESRFNYEFQRFTTNSKTLAAGIYFLLSCTTSQKKNIQYNRRDDCIQITLNSPEGKSIRIHRNCIKCFERIKPKQGQLYLYDVETANNKFVAGIGEILAHNTYPYFDSMNPEGMPLTDIWDKIGGDKNKFMTPTLEDYYWGLEDEEIAKLYSAVDVLMECSLGEGFGRPVIEAMACGCPVIASDNTALTELVKDRGWLVECGTLYWQQFLAARQSYPKNDHIVSALKDCYNDTKKREKYIEEGLKFASSLDYSKLIKNQWEPLIERLGASGIINFEE